MALLEVRDLCFCYGPSEVLCGLNLRLEQGEIACLLGPSGCGKSTVLRCIAGFEKPERGQIFIRGEEVSNITYVLAPEKRKVGVVFQDYALFPHLNVQDNIGFALNKLPRTQRQARVLELMKIVGLEGFGLAYPSQLSGGQQQRVALARALAPEPELILFDEPFSNLDPALRLKLKRELRRILKAVGATALIVTHDQHEAFDLGDKIGVMQDGKILQWDDAYTLYHKPAHRFVASFVGRQVFITGKVISVEPLKVESPLGCFDAEVDNAEGLKVGESLDILVRPDDVVHDDRSPMTAEVSRLTFRGLYNIFDLRLSSGEEVLCMAPSHHYHEVGVSVGIRLELDHVMTFRR